jgi:DNA transformation protein
MASKQANLDFVVEQMAEAGHVSARKMFGEYGIYCREKIVALFCDDQLFVKPTLAGKTFIGKVTEGSPYPGAKPWFLISGDRCEDGEWLSELVRLTERELPPPKPKAAKTKAKTKTKTKSKTKTKAKTKTKKSAKAKPKPQAAAKKPRPRHSSRPKS